MSELELAYKEMQNEGIEINNMLSSSGEFEYEDLSQETEFLNSEDGQTLEKMYELAYGLDCNNIHNN